MISDDISSSPDDSGCGYDCGTARVANRAMPVWDRRGRVSSKRQTDGLFPLRQSMALFLYDTLNLGAMASLITV